MPLMLGKHLRLNCRPETNEGIGGGVWDEFQPGTKQTRCVPIEYMAVPFYQHIL